MLKTINLFFENFFSYSSPYVHFLLRFILGISFFLHGYTKIPISQNFIVWLDSIGVIYAELKVSSFIQDKTGPMGQGYGFHAGNQSFR